MIGRQDGVQVTFTVKSIFDSRKLLTLTGFLLLGAAMKNCIIKNMYSDVKLRASNGKELGTVIQSARGVKLGDNLSPNLFNTYMNDFPEIFDEACDPPSIGAENVKIYCLQYADDLVLFSLSENGLQLAIDKILLAT